MGTNWLDGICLGFSRSSNSYVIGTGGGVVAARTIYRRPSENRWSVERVARLTVTVWPARDKSDATVSFGDAPTEEERRSKRPEDGPQASRINYDDLTQHGFADGCPQCGHTAGRQKSKAGI